MPYYPEERISTNVSSSLENVKQNHEQELMAIDGVEGVGVGRSKIGDDAIIVYLRDEGVKQRIHTPQYRWVPGGDDNHWRY